MWAIITGVLGLVWQGIQAGLDAIVIALQWAVGALKTGLLAAWQAGKFVWSDIVRPVGLFVDKAFTRLGALYTKIIKPGLDWLQRVTNSVKRVYNLFLRPILSTIDNVRRVLKLLELLHLSFAAKLDAELGLLEQKLSLPLQLVIREFNRLTNRVENFVLTAENLFQRVTHLGSIARDIQSIRNISWNSLIGGVPRAARADPEPPAPLTSADDLALVYVNIVDGNDDATGLDIAGALAAYDAMAPASV